MKKKNTLTFTVKHKLEDGTIDEGVFTVKKLSVRDRSAIGLKKSQLSGGMHCVRDEDGNPTGQGLDEETDWLNSMIAQLEVSLLEKPDWFDLENLEDMGPFTEVVGKVVEFESTYFLPKDGGKDDRSGGLGEENSSKQHPAGVSGNDPTPVLGEEVSASLDA